MPFPSSPASAYAAATSRRAPLLARSLDLDTRREDAEPLLARLDESRGALMHATFAEWAVLAGLLVVLLVLDLFVIHRGAQEVSMRDAAWSTAGFVAVSVVFGIVLGVRQGGDVAEQFFAGYLLEKSLSLDNVFVWALIFSMFSVPKRYQHRVLFYGIFTALLLRGAFVAAGAELLGHFESIVYVFGALLLWSGLRMLRGGHRPDAGSNPVVRLVQQLPTTTRLVGHHVFARATAVPADARPEARPMLGWWYATRGSIFFLSRGLQKRPECVS